MAYAKEILYSFVIIFMTVVIMSGAIGGYLLVTDRIDITVFSGLMVGAGVVAAGICTAMQNNIRYVQGIICPYGVYPDCSPAKYALSHGYNDDGIEGQ